MAFDLRLVAAALYAAYSLLAPPVLAQGSSNWTGSDQLALPQPGVAPSGFSVQIAGEHMHRFGEMPLHVLLTPTGPAFVEDRELTFRFAFQPTSVAPHSRSTSYQVAISVAAGSGPVSRTFYLPKWVLGGTLDASVLEQGQVLAGYSGQLGPGGTGYQIQRLQSAWAQSAHREFCWIADPGSAPLARTANSAETADLRVLLVTLAPELLAMESVTTPDTTLPLLKQYGSAAGLSYRTVQELPDDWRGFDQHHVWITRWATYRWLIENRPEAERALRQFIRCGGALWLLDVDDDRALLAHLNTAWGPSWYGDPIAEDESGGGSVEAAKQQEFFESITLKPLPDHSPPVVLRSAYSYGSPLGLGRSLGDPASLQGYATMGQGSVFDANFAWLRGQRRAARERDTFIMRLGLGIIIGVRSSDALPGSFQQWQGMIEGTQEHASSVLTRGIDPIAGSPRFWNWVIPGVAQPPVYTFIGLLALFVVLVGPVAYRKLSRMGRSYLMFFVAPILAAATTLFLFGYGLVADGLGTQSRVREITWVCDRQGGAMRYWRATHFAGVRPRDGLRFAAGTRLEPFYLDEFSTWEQMISGEGTTMGHITLSDDALRLSSGFLPSRQQRQFVGYRPLERAGALVFSGQRQGEKPAVRNEFDYPLREMVLCDAEGRYWAVDEVLPGATADAIALDDTSVARRLGDLYFRNRPELPPGMTLGRRTTTVQLDLIGALVSSDQWRDSTAGQRAARSDAAIENWLQYTLQTASALRRGTFVALSDVTEDCKAIPSATLVESIHYVFGELQ